MKVSFLTTFRSNDDYRTANLGRVVSRIISEFSDWEVVVVEQDVEGTLASSPLIKNINYLNVYNPGAFNKSWGMNVAFKRSSGEILVVCDADMIIQPDDLQRAVSACETELEAVRPFGRLIDMTVEETERFMLHDDLPELPDVDRGYDRVHANEALCMAGGVFVIRREFYKRIGGMDERFFGWGGEDDAMSIKMQGLSSNVAISKNAVAWHIWHPRDNCYSHDHYQKNRQLLKQYKFLSKDGLLELCRQQVKTIGNDEMYLETNKK